MNRYYPAFLDLRDRSVLVVGGGRVAERKIAGLLRAGARVRVVAPRVTARVTAWSRRGTLKWSRKTWEPFPPPRRGRARERVAGPVALVIAATDDGRLNTRISRDCARRGILCNVVDQAGLSSFIAPAVVRRGDLVLAVSTGGGSPLVAAIVARDLGKGLGGHTRLLALARGLRARVRRSLPTPGARKRYFQRLLGGQAGRLACAGRLQEARREARRFLEQLISS